jgi:hypothetical protein
MGGTDTFHREAFFGVRILEKPYHLFCPSIVNPAIGCCGQRDGAFASVRLICNRIKTMLDLRHISKCAFGMKRELARVQASA